MDRIIDKIYVGIVKGHFWLAAKAASHILGPFSDTESYF